MKLFLKPYFAFFVIMYLLVRISRYMELAIPEIINSHLTDLLFMPILLTVSLVGVRILKRDQTIKLTKGMIITSFLFVSLMFEVIMPSRSSLFIKDYWDIAAYAVGTLFFYWVQEGLEVQNAKSIH